MSMTDYLRKRSVYEAEKTLLARQVREAEVIVCPTASGQYEVHLFEVNRGSGETADKPYLITNRYTTDINFFEPTQVSYGGAVRRARAVSHVAKSAGIEVSLTIPEDVFRGSLEDKVE